MPVSNGFLDYIFDQLSKWGGVSARRMFGGVGLFRNGKMFGIVADDVLYFRVDESNREKYEAEGSFPFKPFSNRATIMSYYDVPGDILEDPEELIEWAGESLSIQLMSN
ncbi:TfoX/Sxy family protein [Desulforhopalus sp. IMCC35007]|uniref:TfoX/Sxy family protein n=1 Tax=Desulforhopalus sp. IMCC35007 TaxID=2569543 RepID=UPI0010AEB17B|nr:TfoX/Sxy family protein [Desulforhopalus sp. IMCC35007]TKB06830.1 TfoX/Sxy family protein [Desulforhopalus sp. IMCC35007]